MAQRRKKMELLDAIQRHGGDDGTQEPFGHLGDRRIRAVDWYCTRLVGGRIERRDVVLAIGGHLTCEIGHQVAVHGKRSAST